MTPSQIGPLYTSMPLEREGSQSPLQQKEDEVSEQFTVCPLEVFVPIVSGKSNEALQHLEIIRQREWRCLSDSSVIGKLEKRNPVEHPVPELNVSLESYLPQTVSYPCHQWTVPLPSQSRVCYCRSQGSRPAMEDMGVSGAFPLLLFGEEKTIEFFCVFDGHGGKGCAEFVSLNFSKSLKENLEHPPQPLTPIRAPTPPIIHQTKEGHIWNALKLTIVKLQEMWSWNVLRHRESHPEFADAGSTLCAVVRIDNDLWCANIGDSRAIAFNEHFYAELSQDMKFDEAMGRSIIKRGGSYGQANPEEPVRLNTNLLAMSRAMGDCKLIGLATRPKITRLSLSNHFEKCSFLIASDGLWDIFSSEQIAYFCRSFTQENTQDQIRILNSIVTIAANCTFSDNVFILTSCAAARHS